MIAGVGVNDADYAVVHTKIVDGKSKQVWMCPYYARWKHLIIRCYGLNRQKNNRVYTDVVVCDEWLTFSNFKSWMEKQNWEGKEIDKDLLFAGNKVYSPNTCVFITHSVNSFIIESNRNRGNYLIGVTRDSRWEGGGFISQCQSFLSKKQERLGTYPTEIQAHLAWKSRKRELAIQLANSVYVTDERVAQALINRYQGDGVYIDAVNNNIPVEEFLLNREQYLSKV